MRNRCPDLLAILIFFFLIVPVASAQFGFDMEAQRQKLLERSIKDLGHRSLERRLDAVETLEGFECQEAVLALAQALSDRDARVRERAASALWTLHEIAAPAQAALRTALSDREAAVQIRAAGALAAQGVDESVLLDAYRQVLVNGEGSDQFMAARGLIGHDPGASLAPHLLAYAVQQFQPDRTGSFTRWQHSNQELAERALKRLAQTGDRTVIPALVAALHGPPLLRPVLLVTLGHYDPAPDGWTELLIESLTQEVTRDEAISLLAEQTDPAEVSRWVPAVARSVDASPGAAIRALRSMKGLAHAGLPAIIGALESGDDRVRDLAVDAIGAICDRTQPIPQSIKRDTAALARPALIAVAGNPGERSTRRDAVRNLMKLQLEPASLVPPLIRLLGSDEPYVIEAALAALSSLGAEAEPARSTAESLRDHHDRVVRARAGDLLKTLDRPPLSKPPAAAASAPPSTPPPDPQREARGLKVLTDLGLKFDEGTFSRAITDLQVEAVEAFLDAGMSADHRFDRLGFNTLHTLLDSMNACNPAVRPSPQATLTIAGLLIERGADVNAQHDGGLNTPLMFALTKCDAAVVRLLLKAGADPEIRNMVGQNAYASCLLYQNDGVEGLLETGYRLQPKDYQELSRIYSDEPDKLAIIKRAAPK